MPKKPNPKADVANPLTPAYKAAVDNRANQKRISTKVTPVENQPKTKVKKS